MIFPLTVQNVAKILLARGQFLAWAYHRHTSIHADLLELLGSLLAIVVSG